MALLFIFFEQCLKAGYGCTMESSVGVLCEDGGHDKTGEVPCGERVSFRRVLFYVNIKSYSKKKLKIKRYHCKYDRIGLAKHFMIESQCPTLLDLKLSCPNLDYFDHLE
jgi:hypothetical protein